MKKRLLLACCAVAVMTGCAATGYVRADAIDELVTAVTARHDAYVAADTSISPEDAATYLRSAELLRRIVQEAMAGQTGGPNGG